MSMSEIEEDDVRFNVAVEDRRHKELSALLKQISSDLKKSGNTDELLSKNLNKLFNEFILKINELNNNDLESVIEKFSQEIIESNNMVIDELKKRKYPTKLKVVENYGKVEFITIEYDEK